MPGLTLKPSEMVEGGVVPVDQTLLVTESRFCYFDYAKKDGTIAARTVALRIKSKNEETGTEYVQHYSAGSREAFAPSEDGEHPAEEGKYLIALGDRQSLSKNSNMAFFLQNLVNAGFPESKIGNDASVFDGMVMHVIGMPEPKRSGLPRDPNARERVLSIPDQVIKLPWEKGKPAAAAKATTTAKPAAKAPTAAIVQKTVAFIVKKVNENDGAAGRADIAAAVYVDLAKDPDRDAVAAAIYAPAVTNALSATGLTLDGDEIKVAEG